MANALLASLSFGFAACATLALPSVAVAQLSPQVGAEVSTDERRRGLSWSGGRAAASADVAAEIGGVRASGRVVTTRSSARHGGADLVADLGLSVRRPLGPIEIEARARTHLFAGAAGRSDYAEIGAAGFYTLGPVLIDAAVDYAPGQSAIGGDNLYLSVGAAVGVPRTPLTVSAGAGRSSGDADDPVRAARLRPSGRYHDWRVGVEYVSGPATFGLDYVGTDVKDRAAASTFADARHSGDKLLARARIAF